MVGPRVVFACTSVTKNPDMKTMNGFDVEKDGLVPCTKSVACRIGSGKTDRHDTGCKSNIHWYGKTNISRVYCHGN